MREYVLKLCVIFCVFKKMRKGEGLVVRNLFLIFNYIVIIEPFKLQLVTIVDKSGAFG